MINIINKIKSGNKILKLENRLTPCRFGEPAEVYAVEVEGRFVPEEEFLEKYPEIEEYDAAVGCYNQAVVASDFTFEEILKIEEFLKAIKV